MDGMRPQSYSFMEQRKSANNLNELENEFSPEPN